MPCGTVSRAACPRCGVPDARPPPPLASLVGLGLLAAALFSATFVLNRAVSLAGGHWAWNAALRYVFMAALFAAWVAVRHGSARLGAVLGLFRRRLGFWLVAGGAGFGVFYAGICYAAGHAPGWIVAATWQLTVLAAPLVQRMFGARVPLHGLAFCLLIVGGVAVLNAGPLLAGVAPAEILAGVLPVVVAAFANPVGNQMVNRLRHGGGDGAALVADTPSTVLLLTLGALPVFALLLLVTWPPLPGPGQLAGAAGVALVSGGLATTLFLRARNSTADPFRIAAVDATQAGEVAFALAGEVLFLGASWPDGWGWAGLLAVTAGLAGFVLAGRNG